MRLRSSTRSCCPLLDRGYRVKDKPRRADAGPRHEARHREHAAIDGEHPFPGGRWPRHRGRAHASRAIRRSDGGFQRSPMLDLRNQPPTVLHTLRRSALRIAVIVQASYALKARWRSGSATKLERREAMLVCVTPSSLAKCCSSVFGTTAKRSSGRPLARRNTNYTAAPSRRSARKRSLMDWASPGAR
jgi:hypothetical protein